MRNRRRTKRWIAAAVSGAVVAGTAVTAILLGTGTSPADPASLTLDYSCPFPLIGTQQLKIVISADVPATATVGEPVPRRWKAAHRPARP